MRLIILATLLFLSQLSISAQNITVNQMAHSHNDYAGNMPFYKAYSLGFASIEADIFLVDGNLYVAHTKPEIDSLRTLKRLYIDPVVSQMELHGGRIYADSSKLQLYIDLKTDYKTTIPALTQLIKPVRDCFDTKKNPYSVKIILSGNVPPPAEFANYDDIFFFDGFKGVNYTPEQLERVGLYNMPFYKMSKWNGNGRMVAKDYDAVKNYVDSLHAVGKPVRFWATPDTKTAYQTFIKLGVDFINTDKPEVLADFLSNYNKGVVTGEQKYEVYKPTYETDGIKTRPKNIILLISNSAGLTHLWSTATVNGGKLNMLNFKNVGLVNTSSTNDYTTDSAAGGTAYATGTKTDNRRIGVDKRGERLANIPEVIAKKGMLSAIVTTDKLTGDTPASFYAHQPDRNSSGAIMKDLLSSPVSVVLADYDKELDKNDLLKRLSDRYDVCYTPQMLPKKLTKPTLCLTNHIEGIGAPSLSTSFKYVLESIRNSGPAFFIMAEGAKIDFGAHANNAKTVVDEYVDFDKTVAQALEFADKDKNTLVIVVSNHETGGMCLYDGNYAANSILAGFATTEHTGLPVPIFAYGPQSYYFKGFMQNQDVNKKILTLLKVK